MFILIPAVVIDAHEFALRMTMSISTFGYILLAGLSLLAAYLVGVAEVEPPLEQYEPPTIAGSELPPAGLPARPEAPGPDATDRA